MLTIFSIHFRMELCELYILEQDYAKAAFCCEELVLQNPHNHIYYQRYFKDAQLTDKQLFELLTFT